MSAGSPATKEVQRAGWGFQVLPFIEADAIWKGGGKTTVADCQIVAISTPNPNFFCPSRRAPAALPAHGSWYGPGGTYPHAPTDYCSAAYEGNGVVRQRNSSTPAASLTKMATITDGTSNTVVVGDARKNVAALGQYQGDDNEGYSSGWDHDANRRTDQAPLPDPRTGDGQQRFGSSHTGGFNMLFADGAVRFLTYDIDITSFARMGNVSDGQVITYSIQ